MVCVGSMACSCCSVSGCPGTMANEGGDIMRGGARKMLGLGPRFCGMTSVGVPGGPGCPPMGPGPRLRSQGQARSMGWLQGQLDPLYLSQRALGLPRCALYQNRAVAQARNVLVQQESALRRSSRKHARLRCRGVPGEQRTPRVEPPSRLRAAPWSQAAAPIQAWAAVWPCAGPPGETGTGWSPLPKAWSCSRCRSTAWAGSVAVSAG
ncbi:hypothetical protein MRX96_027911 [Rhipicephalus microplus]